MNKNTATYGKLIIAVHAWYVYVYTACTSWSGRLQYNYLFVGLGAKGVSFTAFFTASSS